MASKKTAKKTTTQKNSGGIKVLVAGTLAAAAAGGFYFYGTNGKKRRKEIKGWMLKAKGEALEKIERLKEVDAVTYARLIDEVTKKYQKVKSIDKGDIETLSKELKAQWKDVERHLNPAKKKPSAKKKKAVSPKKVTKKTA